jgi:hypothetical protein
VLNAYSPRGGNPEWAGPIVGQAYDKIVVGLGKYRGAGDSTCRG